MPLAHTIYGKAKVRTLRIVRDGNVHTPRETSVTVLLEGAFDASYTDGDNRSVVATDSIKNIVNIVGRKNLAAGNEAFAVAIGQHLLQCYDHVSRVFITLVETPWARAMVDGAAHPHGFVPNDKGKPIVEAVCDRNGETVTGGVRDLVVMKSTGSGWADFVHDEFATLQDTADRILATSIDASWLYAAIPPDYAAAHDALLAAMLREFYLPYSPGVQKTLYEMGNAALAAVPEVERITLTLPNIHYIPIDLSPFGLDNPNVVFVPTNEPHGQIQATISRR